MNRLYILSKIILPVLFLFPAIQAQTATTQKKLVLYDMQLQADGSIYEDANFKITATHCTGATMATPTVLECLFGNGSRDNLGYIGLYDTEVNNTVNGGKAYIDITYKGGYSVSDIQFIGFGDEGSAATSESKFYIGPNTIDGLPFYEGADYSLTGGAMVDRTMVFDAANGLENACSNASALYDIPDVISKIELDFSGGFPPVVTETPYSDMRNTIKDMRLEWTSARYASVTKVMGIIITYEDEDISTGIGSENGENFTFGYRDNTVGVSQQSDLKVYSLHGALVASQTAGLSVSLSHLPAGIYIVKACTLEGKETHITKILKK